MYAQSNYGLARYFSTGWLDDNISGLSSGGYTEQGATVDLVAPGDLSWASCDANTGRFSDCTSLLGNPSAIEISGGTSESSPFVAGAAALVIQAYRKTHGGGTPSPALVKQIILSTATDLGIPAQEQGAGLLNSYKAVQLAESIGRTDQDRRHAARVGHPARLRRPARHRQELAGHADQHRPDQTQTVSLRSRALGPDQNKQSGTVTLNDSASDQLIDFADYPDNYAVFHFTVPASQSRLDVSIAYPADGVGVIAPVSLTLIDPKGRYAANSDPQGIGNYGNVDVRTPAAGTWTAVVNDVTGADGGFTGAVSWQAVTERFTAFGTVTPSTTTIARARPRPSPTPPPTPAAPGDYAAALELSSSLGGPTSIPVVLRSLVNPAAGGTFSRGAHRRQRPPGERRPGQLLLVHRPARHRGDQRRAGARQRPARRHRRRERRRVPGQPGRQRRRLRPELRHHRGRRAAPPARSWRRPSSSPPPGTWTLVVTSSRPPPGPRWPTRSAARSRSPRPAGWPPRPCPTAPPRTLPAGAADTIPVTITNTGTAPEDYFLDPRLTTTATMTLAPITPALGDGSNTSTLPLGPAGPPEYWVPSHSTSVTVRQTSTRPAMTDLSPYSGDPDVASAALSASSLCGRSATAAYTAAAGDVTSGLWQPGPTECGPYPTAATPAKATDTVTVTSLAFDRAMTVADRRPAAAGERRGRVHQGEHGHRRAQPGRLGHRQRDDHAVGPRPAPSSAARSTSTTSRPAWRRTPTRPRARCRRCPTLHDRERRLATREPPVRARPAADNLRRTRTGVGHMSGNSGSDGNGLTYGKAQRGGRADRPGRARAVPVLADVQERRLRRAGLQRPGPPGHRLRPRLRARLPVLGEHARPRSPRITSTTGPATRRSSRSSCRPPTRRACCRPTSR